MTSALLISRRMPYAARGSALDQDWVSQGVCDVGKEVLEIVRNVPRSLPLNAARLQLALQPQPPLSSTPRIRYSKPSKSR